MDVYLFTHIPVLTVQEGGLGWMKAFSRDGMSRDINEILYQTVKNNGWLN